MAFPFLERTRIYRDTDIFNLLITNAFLVMFHQTIPTERVSWELPGGIILSAVGILQGDVWRFVFKCLIQQKVVNLQKWIQLYIPRKWFFPVKFSGNLFYCQSMYSCIIHDHVQAWSCFAHPRSGRLQALHAHDMHLHAVRTYSKYSKHSVN